MRRSGPRETYLRYHGDALVLRLARFVWQMHILSAILLAYMLHRVTAPQLLWPWVVWMAGFAIIQAYLSFRGTARANAQLPLARLALAFDASAILLALGWGWLALVLLPAEDDQLRIFVGFVISGGVLTGAGTHNMRYRMLVITLSIIMLAQASRAWLDDAQGQGLFTALMLVLFLGLMLGLGWVLRGFTRHGLILQWEKMQLAEQLEAARAEAVRANDAKSRFLAQASHDLRQPIHAMGLLLASQSSVDVPEGIGATLGRLKQSVDVLSRLFTSLLDVTLLDTQQIKPSPKPFSLSDLIDEIVDEYTPAAHAAGCMLEAQASPAHILSDPLIVRRILQNLVSNSIRHGEGTAIRISSRMSETGTTLQVRDWGPGIDKAEQARLFEAFETGHPLTDASDGVGLGLAIVARLANLAGTDVSVNSKPGEGAVFEVGPFANCAATDVQALVTEPDPLTISDRTGTALVIDDDRAILAATGALLQNWGWTVDLRCALDPHDIDALARPDLVICDYDLRSRTSGLKLIERLRKRFGSLPALIVTGSSSPQTLSQIREAGILVLLKPVRPAQLRSALISLMG